MKKNSKGVLTVEAALIFPLFIIFIAFIINFLNIFYAHTIMQNALFNTSKQISELVYVLNKMKNIENEDWQNILESIEQGQSKKQSLEEDGTKVLESMSAVIKTIIPGEGQSIDLENIGAGTEELLEDIERLSLNLEDGYPDYIYALAIYSSVNFGEDMLIESIIKGYLNNMGYNIDKNIESIRVESNILDFDLSDNKNGDITITVKYDYKNNFAIKFYDKLTMVNTVTVHPWIGGEYSGEDNDK